jgi:hypothetical protein
VFKSIVVLLFAALFANLAIAANVNTLTARTGVMPAARSLATVHPFVNVPAIQVQTTLVFVSDAANNVVDIYDKSGNVLGQIGGFSEPQGLAVDEKGNLYVANTLGNNVLIYAPPYTTLTTTLTDAGQYPVGVSTYNNGKFVAVTNIIDTSSTAGSVTIYKNGVQGPTITDPSIARAYFCGFDNTGNLYLDYITSDATVGIGEIANVPKKGVTFTALTTTQTIEFPGGVEAAKRNVAVLDQDAQTIYTFAPPVAGSLGAPIDTTALNGAGDPVTFWFGPNFKDVWIGDAENADAVDYRYPAGGSAVSVISIPSSQPIGVAVYRTR